jgi:AcrR family transcriptional regulator
MITETPVPTRERILDAAVDLFGRQGYAGTSVGEIEAAAGLSPRSGALYKHFPSKADVLRAAVGRRSRETEALEATAAVALEGDPLTELEDLGAVALATIARDQPVLRIIMKEGENFPELRDEFRDRVVRRGHRTTAAWLRLVIERAGADSAGLDVDAIAAVMLAPMISYRVLGTLFGEAHGGVGEDRYLAAWTQTAMSLLEAHGLIPDAEGGAT